MADNQKPPLMPGLVSNPEQSSMRVGVQDNRIVIEFSNQITHAYMSPGETLILISHLIEAVIKITSAPQIIRPN